MEKKEAFQRIAKLKETINYHRYLYHVFDRQEISDEALDSLKHELYQLEQQYPEFITPDSPTQRVGGEPQKQFKKVEHLVPMLSIEDVFSEKELNDWQKYLNRLIPGAKFDYFCELKIDGFAVSLVYQDGFLTTGATRGNGKIGEEVTQNLKTIESIPLRLCSPKKRSILEENINKLIRQGRIEIRGEVYMAKKDFTKFNEDRTRESLSTYANPRNLAAGSIRQLDSKLAASRPLRFLAYGIATDFGQKKHSQEHQILDCLGFKVNSGKICERTEEVVNYWREIEKEREELSFQIDGIVINVDDNAIFQKLGKVGKSFRGTRAFKFSPKQATSRIEKIEVQVGRTGAITPVAYLEPVVVEGVTITRATLHNEDEIKRLGVKIGDTVIVERAGDVIPAVLKVLPELRTGQEKDFKMPLRCPSCGGEIIRQVGEVVWRCKNEKCPGRRKEALYHFVSCKSFDIDGLGPKIIDQLLAKGLISEFADIFSLREKDLVPLERFAEKSAQNLVSAINKSKKIPLSRFIFSLGIRHVGEETAVDLADYFGSIKRLIKASLEDLSRLPNIGPETGKSIHSWLNSKDNLGLISALQQNGVEIINPRKAMVEEQKLKGQTFVFTGTLDSMTRDQAKEKVRLLGGDVSEAVSARTTYLVADKASSSSKFIRAKKRGVKIINATEFLKMIN